MDSVGLVIDMIHLVLQKYEEIQSLQDEVRHFRQVLEAVKDVLTGIQQQFHRGAGQTGLRGTSLKRPLRLLRDAIADGSEVLEECAKTRKLRVRMFSGTYLGKLRNASDAIQEALNLMATAGVCVTASLQQHVQQATAEIQEIKRLATQHKNEVADVLTELVLPGIQGLPDRIVEQLQSMSLVTDRQDCVEQVQDIVLDAELLRGEKAFCEKQMLELALALSVDEQQAPTTTGGRAIRSGNDKEVVPSEFCCPISLELMEDPVLLVQSGITYDRKSICCSLIHEPDLDPLTGVRYDDPLVYAPNVTVRQTIMRQFGDDVYRKYNDDSFQKQYQAAWDRHARQDSFMDLPTTTTRPQVSVTAKRANTPYYQELQELSRGMGRKTIDMDRVFTMLQESHQDDPVAVGLMAMFYDERFQGFTSSLTRIEKERASIYWKKAENLGLSDEARAGCEWAQFVEARRLDKRDDNASYQLDLQAALGGFSPAQHNVGRKLWDGEGVSKDQRLAYEWFQKGAGQLDAGCQCAVGYARSEGGEGVAKDASVGVQHTRMAADQGYSQAHQNLAYSYEHGEGVSLDLEVALRWYTRAAEQNLRSSQYNLAFMYYNGKGVAQNYKLALRWFLKGANQNDPDSQYYVGHMHYHGKGVAQDYTEAYQWFLKGAENGDSDCQTRLGSMLCDGEGVEKNIRAGIEWYEKAADGGDSEAYFLLGFNYLNGEGVEENPKKAFSLFLKAAKADNVDAQNQVGDMYDTGVGVGESKKSAFEWYTKAANQGDAQGQANLATAYYNGEGVTQSYQFASKWFHKAAEQGNAQAQHYLGLMYAGGNGVEQDMTRSFEYFEMASKQDYSLAMVGLAIYYENGEFVEKDEARAAYWYQKAAEDGNALAQKSLAAMYEQGSGVERDHATALEWYKKALEGCDDSSDEEEVVAKIAELTAGNKRRNKRRGFFRRRK